MGSAGSIATIVNVIRIGQMVIQPIGLRLRIATVSAATISAATVPARHIGPRPIAKRTPARAHRAPMRNAGTSALMAAAPIAGSTVVAMAVQAVRAALKGKRGNTLCDSRVRTPARA